MRHVDYTGVSGIGVVAYGVVFSDGQVALRWMSEHPATSIWASLDDVLAVHGHGQATSVQWIDQPSGVIDELAASPRTSDSAGRRGRNSGTRTEVEPRDPAAPPPEMAVRAPDQRKTNGTSMVRTDPQQVPRQPGRHRKSSSSSFTTAGRTTDNTSADTSQHNGLV